MSFDEFWNKEEYGLPLDGEELNVAHVISKAAYNFAIDEAVKVVTEEDSDNYIAGPVTKFLIKEIKELKE